MSRRPEGTDGSDHGYRMVVEERYQVIAYNKQMCQRLLPLHALLVIVQSIWLASPTSIGYSVNGFVYAFFVAEVIALFFWYFAKVGTQREDTTLLKGFGTTLILIACMTWGTTAGYFMVTAPHLRVPSLMAGAAAEKLGWTEGEAFKVLDSLDVLLRVAVVVIVSATAFFANALVQVKMKQRKQERLRVQASKSD